MGNQQSGQLCAPVQHFNRKNSQTLLMRNPPSMRHLRSVSKIEKA